MAFFSQPYGGADTAGGLFPASEIQVCRNRSGSDMGKGTVVCLDLACLLAALDGTDSNTFVPGGGDTQSDTVWNCIRLPNAGAANSFQSGRVGTLFGVTLQPIANGRAGKVQFYGIVDDAIVIDSDANAGSWGSGDPLTANTSGQFDRSITASNRVVATALFPDEAITNAAAHRRVFVHNGVGFASGEIQITT